MNCSHVTVLGLVGGAPGPSGGETPRVADSSAAGAGRFFHNSVPPSKQNRLGKPPEQCATFARSINLSRDFPQATLDRGDAFGTVHSNKASRHSARPLTIATPPLPVDLGLNHGRRVLDRISVDQTLSELLAGDLVGADARESMDVRGRLAGAAERESTDLAAVSS